MQYIELNPVRAGIVAHPSGYPWSSFSGNGLGESNAILTPHNEYLLLANGRDNRLKIYNNLLESKVDVDTLTDSERSLYSGTPLGSAYFKEKVEKILNCRVGYIKQGRPASR